MPGKITPSISVGDTTSHPSPETTDRTAVGKWRQKGIKEAKTDAPLISRGVDSESDRDSGLGSPVSERSISPFSDSDSPSSFDSFSFDDEGVFLSGPDFSSSNPALQLQLEKRVGNGSHGAVYKVAVTDDSGQSCFLALKTYRAAGGESNEFRIMRQLQHHPAIVRCYGQAEVDGESGILFEFISGPDFITLNNKLISTPMPVGEFINALKYLEQQKLEAVAVAGEAAVVHADLKPSNILLDTETGTPRLIDFGQACLEGEDFDPGHVDYAAPETLKTLGMRSAGPKADTRMDSYSLGQMLYQTITGAADGEGEPYMFGVSFAGTESNRDARLFQTVMAMMSHQNLEARGTPHRVFPDDPGFVKEQALKTERQRLGQVDEKTVQESARQLEPELKEIHSLINSLMQLNPDKRMTARAALGHPWFKTSPADPGQARETLKKLFG